MNRCHLLGNFMKSAPLSSTERAAVRCALRLRMDVALNCNGETGLSRNSRAGAEAADSVRKMAGGVSMGGAERGVTGSRSTGVAS